MAMYSARGFTQALMPRGNFTANIKMLNFIPAQSLYEISKPLITDEMGGPVIEHGDKVVVLDYLDGISAFWEIEFQEME